MKNQLRAVYAFILAGGLALATGCDLDSHDPSDHDTVPGKGALIVDNRTYDDLSVFIDGQRQNNVGDNDDRAFDLAPGVYRVILDQRGGTRSWRDEVDVVEGKRTILDVSIQALDNEYDVEVFFD